MRGSVPPPAAIGASPLRAAGKASSIWLFCRMPLISRVSYWPLPLTPGRGPCGPSASRPTMPLADFCAVVGLPHGFLSPVSGTRRRPPGVSSTAFTAHLPDLQPRPLMDMGFAVTCPLARPGLPPIRWFCSALPSDPASRRAPLRFASPSPPSGWAGDSHPRAVEHARHRRRGPRSRRSGAASHQGATALRKPFGRH